MRAVRGLCMRNGVGYAAAQCVRHGCVLCAVSMLDVRALAHYLCVYVRAVTVVSDVVMLGVLGVLSVCALCPSRECMLRKGCAALHTCAQRL